MCPRKQLCVLSLVSQPTVDMHNPHVYKQTYIYIYLQIKYNSDTFWGAYIK